MLKAPPVVENTPGGTFRAAVNVSTAGPSDIIIDQAQGAPRGNTINFNPGVNFLGEDHGFVFTTLGPDSSVVIANSFDVPLVVGGPNQPGINIDTAFAEGIVFADIQTPARIEISNNIIDFNQLIGVNSAIGVDIQNIRGGGFVALQSRANNVITSNLAGQIPFRSPGTTNIIGSILINGQSFP